VVSFLKVFSPVFYAFLMSLIRATCPAHVILLVLITLVIFGEALQVMMLTIMWLLQDTFKVEPVMYKYGHISIQLLVTYFP